MSGLLCSGNVRVGYVDSTGALTGNYIGVVNAVKLGLEKPESEQKQRISKQNDSFGEALDQVEFPQPTACTLSVDDVGDAEVLAWALGGTKAGFTQAAATAATMTITVSNHGQWSSVGVRKLSTVVVKDSTDTTTYVAGTDYILDATAGFIQPLASGAIGDGDELHVTYDAAALTGQTVSVGTRQSIQVRIEGDMKNLATDESYHVVVPKAKLTASGELDFMGEEFLVTQMTGTALTLTGQSPATVTRIDAS